MQKLIRTLTVAALPLLPATINAVPASAQATQPMLQLETSQAIIDGCLAFARGNNINVIITVIDSAGNINAVQRMDGSPFLSLEISQMKARSAAAFRRSSAAVGEIRERNIGIAFVPGIATWEGGLPITMADLDVALKETFAANFG